jgi:2-oxoglutarate ferredoxin oxidoreductase subunit alpha
MANRKIEKQIVCTCICYKNFFQRIESVEPMTDFNFMIGGEAGQGVQSISYILTKTMARGGLHVFASQDYESRIRGGHNFIKIRVSEKPIMTTADEVDLLIALNADTINIHRNELSDRCIILFDGEKISDVNLRETPAFHVPFEKFAEELGGSKLLGNTVALGSALGIVNYNLKYLEETRRLLLQEGCRCSKKEYCCSQGWI